MRPQPEVDVDGIVTRNTRHFAAIPGLVVESY